LSEPFLYHTLRFSSRHKVRALATAIIDPALRTAWKVSSWTRNIQLPREVSRFLHCGEDPIVIKEDLVRIVSCAGKLICLSAEGGVAIPPEIIMVIACGLQSFTMFDYQRAGWRKIVTLSHLGRFTQLRRLELNFEANHDYDDDDDDDDDDYTLRPSIHTSLMPWNLRHLSSLDLTVGFDDFGVTHYDSLLFSKRLAIFLLQCELPALRRVALRLTCLPEMPIVTMTKALSTFFSRHQDLDYVILSGFLAHVTRVLRSVGVTYLTLFLFETPALLLGSLIHPRVQVLRLGNLTQDDDHGTLSYTASILEGILSCQVARTSLRVIEIIRWYYANHQLLFDGESFSWIKFHSALPPLSQTKRDTCEREIRRLSLMLAKAGIALRIVVEL
jgi:hypothetical protein